MISALSQPTATAPRFGRVAITAVDNTNDVQDGKTRVSMTFTPDGGGKYAVDWLTPGNESKQAVHMAGRGDADVERLSGLIDRYQRDSWNPDYTTPFLERAHGFLRRTAPTLADGLAVKVNSPLEGVQTQYDPTTHALRFNWTMDKPALTSPGDELAQSRKGHGLGKQQVGEPTIKPAKDLPAQYKAPAAGDMGNLNLMAVLAPLALWAASRGRFAAGPLPKFSNQSSMSPLPQQNDQTAFSANHRQPSRPAYPRPTYNYYA
ncbi:MAG: hypothetical protein R2857_09495 [Vampirovibrionales bacterium]